MRIAEILSDLTSLRVCDYTAALALVNARPSRKVDDAVQSQNVTVEQKEDEDADLKRAEDLVHLHYALKMKHQSGDDLGLAEARESVRVAMLGLRR